MTPYKVVPVITYGFCKVYVKISSLQITWKLTKAKRITNALLAE